MKRALRMLCIIVIATMMGVTVIMAGQNRTGAAVTNPDYYSLVKKITNNDLNVDFMALRLAYTKTQDYKPYGADDSAKNAAFDALNKKNYAEAVKQAQSVLKTNYVDLDIHLLCRIAYKELGNSEQYAFHTSILNGLAGSLYASGDGTTPEKAIVVISTREEYFFMSANGLNLITQSLIKENGHDYDKMDVENKKSGEKTVIYFNIDIPYGWLTEHLQNE